MTALSVALVAVLAGCQRQAPADVAVPAAPTTVASTDSTAAPAVSDATYRPPTAEQLYALVAPIALFPDRLVAQTLAASTHPDEISTARDFVAQNGNLNGAALIDAADPQPWDPSVKSLVPFPAVLDQLANNAEWTAALGAAYASEPTDVMNAIQVMRGRARARGALQNSPQQTVEVSDRGPPADETVAEDNGIVPAPAQTILIEPAESDVVYVPTYDPDVVYGDPIVTRVYSRGWYEAPPPRKDLVATGLISFGAGVLVGQLFSSHEHREPPRWGWNAWNTSWGGGRPGNPHYGSTARRSSTAPSTSIARCTSTTAITSITWTSTGRGGPFRPCPWPRPASVRAGSPTTRTCSARTSRLTWRGGPRLTHDLPCRQDRSTHRTDNRHAVPTRDASATPASSGGRMVRRPRSRLVSRARHRRLRRRMPFSRHTRPGVGRPTWIFRTSIRVRGSQARHTARRRVSKALGSNNVRRHSCHAKRRGLSGSSRDRRNGRRRASNHDRSRSRSRSRHASNRRRRRSMKRRPRIAINTTIATGKATRAKKGVKKRGQSRFATLTPFWGHRALRALLHG
jgi:hypothetical protein